MPTPLRPHKTFRLPPGEVPKGFTLIGTISVASNGDLSLSMSEEFLRCLTPAQLDSIKAAVSDYLDHYRRPQG